MIYREFPASAPLRHFVDRIWYLEGPAGMLGAEPVPPDGHTEIIVHAGDPFAELAADGSSRVQDRVLLAGQATRAVRLEPRGFARMVGARLRPSGAHALFGVPQHELTNRIADLSQIDRRLQRRLVDAVSSREEAGQMVAAFQRVLETAAAAREIDPVATELVAVARSRRGLVRVGDLAAELTLSARQLERLFQDRVGLTPKMYLRIVRFQEVLRAVRFGAPARRWAHVAADHGFYDQAHFIRDFKAFVGASPGAWNVSDRSLAAVFSAIRRDPAGPGEDSAGAAAPSDRL